MHFATFPAILAGLTALSSAQVGKVYCGAGSVPSAGDCQNAQNKIDDGRDYGTSTEIAAGNCIIRVENVDLSGSASIGGSQLKSVVGDIGSRCNYVGSELLDPGNGQVNVTLLECQVCMYGTCGVCDAPSSKLALREMAHKEFRAETVANIFAKKAEPKRTVRHYKPTPVARNATVKRDGCSHPSDLPDVNCCAGVASSVDSCKELADTVGSMGTLSLPFTTANDDCELAVEQTSSGVTVDSSLIADMIRAGSDGCNSGGYIGYTYDTGRENMGFDVYWGKLCEMFGFGDAGCTTGDPPGGGE